MPNSSKTLRPFEKEWSPPKIGTPSCRDFFLSWSQVNSFFWYVLNMVSQIHRASKDARAALESLSDLDLDIIGIEPLEGDTEDQPGLLDYLVYHRQFLMEVILVRHIENYLSYLSSLLYEIFISRPETLRSSESIDMASVLAHDNMDDLVRSVAERKVESLSYSSFVDLVEYFDDRFSLELFPPEDTGLVVEAIETRNISVHNRCIVNERYIAKTGSNSATVGEKRKINLTDIRRLSSLLGWAVKTLDQNCRSHLGIKGIRFDLSKLIESEFEVAVEERKARLGAKRKRANNSLERTGDAAAKVRESGKKAS